MTKITKTALTLILLLTALLLMSGCGRDTVAEYMETAENYVAKLSEIYGDNLSVTEGVEERFGCRYYVHSEKYNGDFTVNVGTDGGTSDTYYRISLLEQTKEEYGAILASALPGFGGSIDVDINGRIISSHLSACLFGDIHEAQQAEPVMVLLEINVDPRGSEFGAEQISALLQAVQDSGLSASLNYVGGEYEYEVTQDGMYVYMPSGADGGALIERREYTGIQ